MQARDVDSRLRFAEPGYTSYPVAWFAAGEPGTFHALPVPGDPYYFLIGSFA